MLRNRKFWIIVGFLIIVVAGLAAFYFSSSGVTETAADEPDIQTSVARQGDITVSATGAGTGVVRELLVQVGDKVQAGDELASLDDTDSQQALANAELQLR